MDPTTWDAPFPIVVAALFVIVMARANATYWVGRLSAAGARRTRVARWMDADGYRRAVDRINRWGAPAVSASFLTIGVQTLVNLAAGGTRMPLIRYLPATIVGSAGVGAVVRHGRLRRIGGTRAAVAALPRCSDRRHRAAARRPGLVHRAPVRQGRFCAGLDP